MMNTCQSYRLIEKKDIEELNGTGLLYEHIKSGAKLFVIKNNDKNKVFTIGFRTTPKDSTGVAHIMEHSVLCGSRKYPLKDPFVELAKGSLNTFLNAMTFPDKTIYPIASMNDKDFMNLMDVYMDSVFYPNVYKDERIFRQEGWHYELLNRGKSDEELKINGVVYNEMKGAFSNPDSVLESRITHALYPDTTYANESGGLPSDIPELSYEDFLDFHKSYYHPSNSYIYLYGDLDVEEKLAWIDDNYLSHFDRIEVDSHIDKQQAFKEAVSETSEYAIGLNEDSENKAYLSVNFSIEDEPTQVNAIAWQILESVLLSSTGAILREALVKAGIGEDIYGGICQEIAQPFFSVVAKNTDIKKQNDFLNIINDTLIKLVKEGIDKKSLRAELNYLEFKFRESDYGSIPAGLAVCINMFGSWLYDDSPFTYCMYNDAIRELKELIDTDFFEQKIQRFLIDNKFRACVNIVPNNGLTDKENEALKTKLAAYKDTLSDREKDEIASETEALKAYQEEKDAPEVIAMLPVLKVSDIEKNAEKLNYTKKQNRIFTEADTKGIAYARIMFDTTGLNEDEIQFAALLSDILGDMNTSKHSYTELYNEVLLNTGGISVLTEPFGTRNGAGFGFKGMVSADIHTLDAMVEKGFELAAEMICDTVLDDEARLTELLLETKSRLKSKIDSAAHMLAVTRASSYISEGSRFSDLTAGIAYYDFINAACRLTKEPLHMKRFIKSLKAVRNLVFDKERVTYAMYGSKAADEAMTKAIASFEAHLAKTEHKASDKLSTGRALSPISTLNEGFRTSAQVNYVARCGNFASEGLPYTGVLKVLKVMLNYEYLWIKLRVLGGAYGCMSAFTRNGRSYLVSYRDPEVRKTNEVYEALTEYLEQWDADETTVTKYIIGAISALDRPLQPSDNSLTAVADCFFGTSNEELQQERDEILNCSAEDIRGCAAYIRALLKSGAICTIGNEGQINKDAELFKSLRDLS